jgi:aryl-alcohol dehydrogenase-like predicted oxidoreductase
MQLRRLGRSTLEIPPVVFGAWAIGGWWWGASEDEASRAALSAWLDGGGLAIDTAPVYGFGHSERLIGSVLAARRQPAVILTKAGLNWESEQGELFFETRASDGTLRRVYKNSRPAALAREIDASLERLGVERIDLLQIHWPDATTPLEDSLGALLAAKRAGKIAWIGVSNFTPELLERAQQALGGEPLVSTQERLSLIDRRAERGALAWARAHGTGFLSYSPLEQGLLTGQLGPKRVLPGEDSRNKSAKFSPAARARVERRLRQSVAPIAAAHGASLAQVALAWNFQHSGVSAALAGARSAAQARENLAAADLELSSAERLALDDAWRDFDPSAGGLSLIKRAAGRLLGR